MTSKDAFLSSFTYDGMKEIVPELTKEDYKNLIKGHQTTDSYQLGTDFGRFTLKVDANNQAASIELYSTQKIKGTPEIISNTVLAEKEHQKLSEGKFVLLHNDRVAYKSKDEDIIKVEPIMSFGCPDRLGDYKITNEAKVNLLNGEKINIPLRDKIVEIKREGEHFKVQIPGKGLNSEQVSFLENYKTQLLNSNEKEKETLNQKTIAAISQRYFPEQKEQKEKELKQKLGEKGDISAPMQKLFLDMNNMNIEKAKDVKTKKLSIMDQTDDKKLVLKKLSKGIKDIHHKTEKSVGKTQGIISTFTQGM